MADEAQPNTIVVNPQAAWEQSKTSPTSTDTTKSLAPEQVAQAASSDALAKDEAAATAPKAAYDTGVAKIQAAGEANKEVIQGKTLAERSAVDEAQMAKIAARAEDLRKAQEAIKATPASALFADRDGWSKARLAIGLALAGLGDAIGARASATLHEQRAPSAVTNIINMDLDRQKANLQKLSDQQIMAKEGVKDAIQARQIALDKVDLKGVQMLSLAAQHMEAMLKDKGVEAPAIAQNEDILKVRRAEETRKAALAANLTREHTAASSKTETTNRVTDPTPSAPTGRVAMVKNADGTDAGPAPAAAANEVNTETAKRANVERVGLKLLEFAKAHPHVAPGTDDYQNAISLHADMVTALGGVSSLGKSDEANKLEAERMGPTGTGLFGTQPKLISKIIDDNAKAAKMRIKLTAGTAIDKDGTRPAAPSAALSPTAITAPQGQTQPMVPPADQAAAKPAIPLRKPNAGWTDGRHQELVKWARANPNDPRAKQVLQGLSLGGTP